MSTLPPEIGALIDEGAWVRVGGYNGAAWEGRILGYAPDPSVIIQPATGPRLCLPAFAVERAQEPEQGAIPEVLPGCPVFCDPGCDADCHEIHETHERRGHQPWACLSIRTAMAAVAAAERMRIRDLADRTSAVCIGDEGTQHFFSALIQEPA